MHMTKRMSSVILLHCYNYFVLCGALLQHFAVDHFCSSIFEYTRGSAARGLVTAVSSKHEGKQDGSSGPSVGLDPDDIQACSLFINASYFHIS